ncbi:MAG: hypothetical protein E6942_17555, partial [Clostridium argentinense]|nr:hypothetical protein [Clostridium argentinense]
NPNGLRYCSPGVKIAYLHNIDIISLVLAPNYTAPQGNPKGLHAAFQRCKTKTSNIKLLVKRFV